MAELRRETVLTQGVFFFPPPQNKVGPSAVFKEKKKRRKIIVIPFWLDWFCCIVQPGSPLCFVTCNVLSFSPCRVASSAHQDFAILFFK